MEDLCINLCEVGALKFGDFKMKVGLNSPVYFDLRIITSYPSLMAKLSDIVWKHIEDSGVKYNEICGVPYTALPIATLVSVKANTPMLVRRKEPKKYGTMKLVEGKYSEGDSCLIIEDVVTSGGSILETASDLRKDGLIVTDAIVVIDREQGGKINLSQHGIRMHSIFTLSKILELLLNMEKLTSETVANIKHYIKENQIFSDGRKMPENLGANRLKMTYQDRIPFATCEINKKLFAIIEKKKTNLCVAIDVTTTSELIELVNLVGPFVCIIKTHYDAVVDWSDNVEISLKELAAKHNFLIMEDRKLGDIGNTVKLQCKKLFTWANLVTMHSVAGPGSLDGAEQGISNASTDGGLVLIAQLSSKDNLISQQYTKATTDLKNLYKHIVTGFVCQEPSLFSDPGVVQFTPGVSSQPGGDSLGQQYCSPEDAVISKGADVVIVGRAIVQNSNPAKAAEDFKEQLWNAYLRKIKS